MSIPLPCCCLAHGAGEGRNETRLWKESMSVLVGISSPGVLHTVCICYFHLSALLNYQILPKFRSKLIDFSHCGSQIWTGLCVNGNSLCPKSLCLFNMGCNLCYSWVNMNKLLECPASTGWNTKLLQRPPSQTAAVPGFVFIFLGVMQAGTHFLAMARESVLAWEWSGEMVPGCNAAAGRWGNAVLGSPWQKPKGLTILIVLI